MNKISNKNKGGRPPKSLGQAKQYMVHIRMNTQQYYQLKATSQKAKVSISECARELITSGKIVERMTPTSEIMILLRSLMGLANNVNQLTKMAHISGLINLKPEYLSLAEEIALLIKRIRQNDW